MDLDNQVEQEIPYPKHLSWELLERWADTIPVYSENDPENREWEPTPVPQLDLSQEGYGLVHVKDESVNPTGTAKDRPAWEVVCDYRDSARATMLKKRAGELNGNVVELPVPTFTLITAGNAGVAFSRALAEYDLPPPRLLLDRTVSKERLAQLKKECANIYTADLSQRVLSREEIKRVTNNANGVDITSLMVTQPQRRFYDWHVHEVFNESPDEIYLAVGSHRLIENYFTWQQLTVHNDANGHTDPRLVVPTARVAGMSILGATPMHARSRADHLATEHNPFILYKENDLTMLKQMGFTGERSGIYSVEEERLIEAYEVLQKHMPTSINGAAGLALYMQQFAQGKIDREKKILIVNTGKGV